jgi:hypothetical protein
MTRWPILVVTSLALCGCQTGGGQAARGSDDCPAPTLCGDPDPEAALPLGAASGQFAVWRPLFPGCPSTLQVMARPHPIVYRAVRPLEAPQTGGDPSDWVCDPPEAPLLRAMRWRSDQDLATR